MTLIRPMLMFQAGDAEEAMNLYVALFADAEVREIEHYGPGEPGAEGSIKRASFRLGTQELLCIDSPVKHEFGFTPSLSLVVECEREAELDRLFAELTKGGEVMMPPGDYGFSAKFAWVADRFGVSWQLNVA
jgi:predicted 3-demethylubiquinone-9 3-methyltransferase (glyoxalase superfamily)